MIQLFRGMCTCASCDPGLSKSLVTSLCPRGPEVSISFQFIFSFGLYWPRLDPSFSKSSFPFLLPIQQGKAEKSGLRVLEWKTGVHLINLVHIVHLIPLVHLVHLGTGWCFRVADVSTFFMEVSGLGVVILPVTWPSRPHTLAVWTVQFPETWPDPTFQLNVFFSFVLNVNDSMDCLTVPPVTWPTLHH